MPKITRTTGPDVDAPTLDTQGQNINAPSGAFGGQVADAIQGLGDQIGRTGRALGDIELQAQERDNADAVQNAETALLNYKVEAGDKYLQRNGRDAVNSSGQEIDAYDKRAQDIMATLKNERQREVFQEIVDRNKLSYQNTVLSHSRRQLESARNQEHAAFMNSNERAAIQSRDEPESLEFHKNRIVSGLKRDAIRLGQSPEIVAERVASTLDGVHSGIIDSYVADGRLLDAKKHLESSEDEMLPDTINKAKQIIDRENKKVEREEKQDISTQLGVLSDKAALGIYDEEGFTQLKARAANLGDEKFVKDVNDAIEVTSFVAGLSQVADPKIRANQLETIKDNLESGAGDQGLSTQMYVEGLKADAAMNKLLQVDPIAYGNQTQLVNAEPLDLQDQSSVLKRENDLQIISRATGQQVTSFFSPAEFDAFSKQFNQASPQQKVGMAMALKQGAPSTYGLALQQISEKDSAINGYAASLAVSGTEFVSVAQKIFQGKALMDENKSLSFKSSEVITLMDSDHKDALYYYGLSNPKIYDTVAEASMALALVESPDPATFNVDSDITNTILGNSGNTGGVVNINGGNTLLAPGVSKEDFQGFLDNASPNDWTSMSVTGSRPVYGDGRPVPVDDIADEGRFYIVGENTYKVIMGSDNKPLGDEDGGDFVFTISPDLMRSIGGR